jgi:hypothetical protein
MTAFVAAAYADRIEILADTAMTNTQPPFQLVTIGPKIVAHPTLPLAMFAAGDLAHCSAIASGLVRSYAETADELLEQLENKILPHLARRGTAGNHATLYLALHGPAGFQIRFFDTTSALGREPFKLSSNREYALFGPVTEEGFRAHNLNPEMLPLSDGLESRGRSFMELFRRTPGRLPSEPEGTPGRYHSIGGQLQLCTVTAQHASTRTIGYWPDLIGEPIDPAASCWTPRRE